MSKPADQTRLHATTTTTTGIPLCAEEGRGLHKSDKNQRERHKQRVLSTQNRRGGTELRAKERRIKGCNDEDESKRAHKDSRGGGGGGVRVEEGEGRHV